MSNLPHNKPIMDERCPRQLASSPSEWCALAVLRLKARRHAGRELSPEEESKLPGCPWAVSHQMSNYCGFKLMESFLPDDKGFSDIEIAHFLNISPEVVRSVEKKVIQDLKDSEEFEEISDIYAGSAVMGNSGA